MHISVIDFQVWIPRVLEIPKSHSIDRQEYIRTNASFLFPDLPLLDDLEFIAFENRALVFRIPPEFRRVAGEISLPSCIAALLINKQAHGRYEIHREKYKEEFYYDGKDILDHSISIKYDSSDGSAESSVLSIDFSGLQTAAVSLSAERIKTFFAEHLHNGRISPGKNRGRFLQFVWFPIALALATAVILPQYSALKSDIAALSDNQSRIVQLQNEAIAMSSGLDPEDVGDIFSALNGNGVSDVYGVLSDFFSIANGRYKIHSIDVNGQVAQLGIEGPDPLALQDSLIQSRLFQSVVISRITSSQEGSRVFSLILRQKSEVSGQ